jgi:5'-deoxynucleotidase YfbR-like HD superfamily hydrolase
MTSTFTRSVLVRAVVPEVDATPIFLAPQLSDIICDIDAILMAFKLQSVRRYYGQVHWSDETLSARHADSAEPDLKLENVAAHSWHVADAAMILAPHFADLDATRCLSLAILHDKLEMFTGDFDPVGRDGQGMTSHAFDGSARRKKLRQEYHALGEYLQTLRPSIRTVQEQLIKDALGAQSQEARFVRAVDKLQALAFVIAKKAGVMSDEHLIFTLRYSRKSVEYFPRLRIHYALMLEKLLDSVASQRNAARDCLDSELYGQLEMRF